MLENSLFQAQKDGSLLEEEFKIKRIYIPTQAASEDDFKAVQSLGDSASGSMLFTLLVPFGFMLFMSMSMNRVWGMYNMVQLIANITNFKALLIPANSY